MLNKKILKLFIALCTLVLVVTNSSALQMPKLKPVLVLQAMSDFNAISDETKIWYIDEERACLAVDAAKFKDQFASVRNTFSGEAGKYQLVLTGLTETDGESEYRISLNSDAVGAMVNPESDIDFVAVEHDFGEITLAPGDNIDVSFNSATNGKIPEDGGTAYARGRWTKLTLTRLEQ